jgi:hypothetical protein
VRDAHGHGAGLLRWLGAALLATACADSAVPSDLTATIPSDLAVTVYRSPYRGSGAIDLGDLEGFALISETRTVDLPPGLSRVRFEGVADGIEPASAIVAGLADVVEKNREGKLLSPESLVASAVGRSVTLLRTDQKTGKLARTSGTLRADAGGGVVIETSEGIEALRCSGLPETFSFDSVTDLKATPTLSVLVRSREAAVRTVTLSYLARGFDWAADYVATLSADGKSMDLGAWVTLANANGIGFPAAHTQVVAGRVNRESGAVEPLDVGGPILAQCWPRGSTSDSPQYLQLANASPRGGAQDALRAKVAAMMPMSLAETSLGARRVEQEQLGDLKLYRVPDRTTVASRQSKQVRLLDRADIPVKVVYEADVAEPSGAPAPAPASRLLRTTNTAANHLGLPLPSGRVAVFAQRGAAKLLLHESGLGDLAVDEEVEIDLGSSADVEVTVVKEDKESVRAFVNNALATKIQFELRLQLPAGGRIVHADHPVGMKNGRPIFRLAIPAGDSVTVRFQTQHAAG